MNPATDGTIKTPITTNHWIITPAMIYMYYPVMMFIIDVALIAIVAGLMAIVYDKIVSRNAPRPADADYDHMHKNMQTDYKKLIMIGLVAIAVCVGMCQTQMQKTQTLDTYDIGKAYGISIEDNNRYLPILKDNETQTQNIKFKDAKGVEHDGVLTINNKTTKLHYNSSTDKAPTTQPQTKNTTK